MDFIMQQGVEERRAWDQFVRSESLSSLQADQFELYLQLLLEWNKKSNLTRICTIKDVIAYHFQDSMRLADYVDLSKQKGLADIGCGPGFPGIPLKIVAPSLPVVLIEVNQKKVAFLREVISRLGLDGVEVSDLDWRTFLRKTNFNLDLFCARASLQPSELLRMFSKSSPYQAGVLVYFASKTWNPDKKVADFMVRKEQYSVGSKQRSFVFFASE